jgi:hypothetical protein
MAGILRITAKWTGAAGLPGYSVFHFRDYSTSGEPDQAMADGAATKVRAFFSSIAQYIPAVVSVAVQTDAVVVEDTTNTMTGVFSVNPGAAVQGSAAGSEVFAAPVGAVVTWRTGTVKNGRIIRGRTFLVPLVRGIFDVDGTLNSVATGTLNTAATALRAGEGVGDLGVYARPSSPTASDGQWAAVTGHSIPDMGAVLRSRRD